MMVEVAAAVEITMMMTITMMMMMPVSRLQHLRHVQLLPLRRDKALLPLHYGLQHETSDV
jgi:hypothetical protein